MVAKPKAMASLVIYKLTYLLFLQEVSFLLYELVDLK